MPTHNKTVTVSVAGFVKIQEISLVHCWFQTWI